MNANLLEHEKKVYSQNGEDGIIRYLFSKLATTNKVFVEVGFSVLEGNTLNLAINGGWFGLLIDGSKNIVLAATRYFHRHPKVKCVNAFVTKTNINQLLVEHGVQGEIDLLSIDIDGNDFWVWAAIEEISPRVVVIEYNADLGKDRSITVMYDDEFRRYQKHSSGLYHGASLLALTRLAHLKGYILLGCESSGTNAFFIRNDVAEAFNIDECAVEHAYLIQQGRNPEPRFNRIKHLEFREVVIP